MDSLESNAITKSRSDFSSLNPLGMILCGLSLLFIYLYRYTVDGVATDKRSTLLSSIFLCASSLTGSVAPYPSKKYDKNLFNKITESITSAVLCSLIIIVLNKFIGRTPVPTCAVILIIGMWQQNIWKYLNKAFTSGLTGIIAFLSVITVILLVNPETGVITAAFICAAYKLIENHNIKENI